MLISELYLVGWSTSYSSGNISDSVSGESKNLFAPLFFLHLT